MENRKTILAIDDNRDILYTLEQICRFQDWVPLLAAGYEEAERFIKNERIDLILVDYHMPGVDGITAVKEIRKRLPKTPIIVPVSYTHLFPASCRQPLHTPSVMVSETQLASRCG